MARTIGHGPGRVADRRQAVVALALAGALILAACGGDDDGTAAAGGPGPRAFTYGRAALGSEATRVIEITMNDEMRFVPAGLRVERGETVTFRLRNDGQLPHEFTIGGPKAHELHELEMASMDMGSEMGSEMGPDGMDMATDGHAHSEPMGMGTVDDDTQARIDELDAKAAAFKSVHVAPGETVTLSWTFDGDEAPTYGCHVPGHYDAGMHGRIEMA